MDKAQRQVLLLAVLFAVSGTGSVVIVTVAAVTALDLTGSTSLATLPVALSLVGGMAATVPASHFMARFGRRAGFRISTSVAIVGASLAVVAIHRESFVLFCAASALIGVVTGVASLYRFAAVEVSDPGRQARAIGTVLAGGVAAGVLGPLIAFQARDLWAEAPFAGSYLVMAVLAVVVLLLLNFLEVPRPPPVVKGSGRPLSVIARDPRFVAAALAGIAAFSAMVITMVAAPLSLAAQGHANAIQYVIQAHVVAMYLPSFFSGALVGRTGPARGMMLGIAGLAACGVVNLLGASVAHHYVALVLLGIGWNLLFVSATALLTTVYRPSEKATVQGVNDVLVSASAAVAAFGSGAVHAVHGWSGLNLDVLVGLVLATVALLILMRAGRSAPSPAHG
ncbi:MAG: MFS transporter [Candidatus Thermoplasmatota archaeon]